MSVGQVQGHEDQAVDVAVLEVAHHRELVLRVRIFALLFVRLVERSPFLPLPAWNTNLNRPIDEQLDDRGPLRWLVRDQPGADDGVPQREGSRDVPRVAVRTPRRTPRESRTPRAAAIERRPGRSSRPSPLIITSCIAEDGNRARSLRAASTKLPVSATIRKVCASAMSITSFFH